MRKLRWQDAFDIKPSKNTRGENTFDVYRKDTDIMIAADVLAGDIDKFLEGMTNFGDRIATEELEAMLGNEIQKPSTEPAEVEYSKLTSYDAPWIKDEDVK